MALAGILGRGDDRLVFGTIYVALPAITGALLTEPIQLIPIPFVDFTQVTGNFIPATPLGFTAHLGPIFVGLVVPFWGVIGTFIGVVVASIANPLLYTWTPSWREMPYLNLWQQGMGTIETVFVNQVDFWMSFASHYLRHRRHRHLSDSSERAQC